MLKTEVRNVTQHFFAAAEAYPDNIAIVEKDNPISYADFSLEVQQTASYFRKKGIGVRDRVLVFVPMSIDLYRTVLALFSIGATAVFLDEWVSMSRLRQCCVLADCKGFIGTPKANVFRWFARELRKIPVRLSLKGRAALDKKYVSVPSDTTALITFTTGSTGIPKAADRSHAFLDAQFRILKEKTMCSSNDVDMPVLPIVLFVNLGVGATSVIAAYNSRKPESLSAARLVAQLRNHKVTRLTASPYVVRKIAEELLSTGEQLESLKQVFTGGAPVFPSEARIYCKAFKETEVNIIYGSTEAEPISAIKASALSCANTSAEGGLPVGEVHPLTQLRIVSVESEHQHDCSPANLDSMTLAEGEIGEIIVAGEHVLKRYFRNPEAIKTNKVKVGTELWHRTGDSGFLRDGKLFLTGRCGQLIKNEKHYLSPFIIENQLQAIVGVKMGTLIELESKRIVVLETNESESFLEPHLCDLTYDSLVLTKKIARDPRHNSKIDYGKLKSDLLC